MLNTVSISRSCCKFDSHEKQPELVSIAVQAVMFSIFFVCPGFFLVLDSTVNFSHPVLFEILVPLL
jgi:hypothetical protein